MAMIDAVYAMLPQELLECLEKDHPGHPTTAGIL